MCTFKERERERVTIDYLTNNVTIIHQPEHKHASERH